MGETRERAMKFEYLFAAAIMAAFEDGQQGEVQSEKAKSLYERTERFVTDLRAALAEETRKREAAEAQSRFIRDQIKSRNPAWREEVLSRCAAIQEPTE